MTSPAKSVLSGRSKDSGRDEDGNGLFDFLQVDLELDAAQDGGYGFTTGLLGPGGQLVAVGALTMDRQRSAPVTSARLSPGRQVVPIYFDGRAIRASGIDGPYTVRVGLSDEAAMIASADYVTQPYTHLDFQGPAFEIRSVGDSGVATDSRAGYESLRISIAVGAITTGTLRAQGQLFAGSAFVSDATSTLSLAPGAQVLNLDFPATAIASSGLDGPYTVYLSLAAGADSANPTHTTAPYRHTDFRLVPFRP